MWVKICANTNFEDAALAAELGADALGFVFAPSARRVDAAQVAAITEKLPDNVEKIGVFHDPDFDAIAETVHAAGLTGVQMHFALDRKLIALLTECFEGRLRLIQTVHWIIEGTAAEEVAFAAALRAAAAEPGVWAVLVDSKKGAASGGTGVASPWEKIAKAAAEVPELRLIVAGGLRGENVAEAIRVLRPFGVDVASGVERADDKRCKDMEKLRAFLANARS